MTTKRFFVLIGLCLGLVLPMQAQKQISAKLTEATVYLRWQAVGYLPSVAVLFLSNLLRNMNRAKLPALAVAAAFTRLPHTT